MYQLYEELKKRTGGVWRESMIDPTRERQLTELNLVELCAEILARARNELYFNMHFLDLSLSSLGFEADWGLSGYGIGTDGFLIYYQPEYLAEFILRKGGYGKPRVSAHGFPLFVRSFR